ncbi:hypothetical protein DL98DRAFT_657386 [Cadophora sp. DSE1049]|nr:hypothetical protein DL98DRAFT_657386 [Cadophora sp. DSE1049]
MSERSSGTTRRTRSSLALTIEGSADLPGGADTSGTLEEEVSEPAAVEAFYIRGSSKRIRPEDVQKVFEKEGKKLGTSDSQKKEIDTSPAEGQDQQFKAPATDAPKRRPWTGLQRYFDKNKTSAPDYGPSAFMPKTPQEAKEEMPPMNVGAFRPYNSLVSNPNPNPKHKPQRPVSQKAKAFDLTGDARSSRLESGNPAKRQRIDPGSSNRPIDLDVASPQNVRQSVPSSTWSGQSHSRSGQERNTYYGAYEGVREHRKVEETVRPPKKQRTRNGSATDNRNGLINGHQRFNPESFDQIEREDQNDRISDGDDGDEVKIIGHRRPLKPNKILEVQIQGSEGSRYERPQGQKPYATSTNSNNPPSETAQASRYFHSDRGPLRDQVDSKASRQVPRMTNRAKQDLSLLSQDDQDELSTDQYGNAEHASTAQRFLRRSQPTKPGDREGQGPAIDAGDSSEDEISNKQVDIIPGRYGPSKTNSRKPQGEDVYVVHQVFSESKKWLLEEQLQRWMMVHDISAGLLSFFDRSNELVFQFSTKELERIELASGYKKMVLHKSRTQAAAGSTHIYVEVGSSDECEQLFENLKRHDSVIGKIPKTCDNLDKVFRNVAQKPVQAKRQRPVEQEEPEDIRLAKARAKKRFGENLVNDNKASRNTNGGNQRSGNLEQGTRSKGVAKDMRGRSPSNEFLEVEELRRGSSATALQAGEFYGNSSNARNNGADSHGTRSSGRLMAKMDSSPAYRQSPRQRPRSPSPEPERWTSNHPDWVKEVGWQSSVIYPPGGKNKATVDMQDIQRLDEGEFLNDNLIVFYLRWLEDRLVKDNPELASRIYFHNTFFYTRLTKHGKGKSGGINYEAVERWTAKFDLLKYDYIVVPVNETVHWYVAIICNAPKLIKQPLEETVQPDAENGVAQDGPSTVDAEGQPTASPPKSPAKTIPDEVNTEMKEMTLEDHSGEVPSTDAPQGLAAISVTSEDQKDTEILDHDSQPVIVSSDIGGEKPVQVVQPKKGKRKSAPPPRKYDPKEPRIITLDSLGLSHSPTCANLKRYLLQEIKAKKNIEIEEPRNLGMTAKNIPQQDNHCDCGLFLLTYIEEFLKRPDGFIHDILQQNEQDFRGWRSASDMRRHIRERLFELQKEQVREADASKKEKAKSKHAAKAGDKHAPALTSKSASREASKSARSSASPEKAQPLREDVDHVPVEKVEKQERPKLIPAESAEKQEKEIPTEPEPSKSDTAESRKHALQISDGRGFIHRTLSAVTSYAISHYGRSEEKDAPDSKTSASQPITIEDSQDMDDDPKEAPVEAKQVQEDPSTRSSVLRSSRDSKIPGTDKAIEIPESPRKESSKKPFVNPHPLPNSSQEQEEVQQKSPRAPGRLARDSKHRGSGKTKAINRLETHQNIQDGQQDQEWNGIEPANPDESFESVQLLEAPVRQTDHELVANRQQEEDDEMLLKDPPSRASPPPEVSYLSSSSTPEVVHKSSVLAISRSRGKTAPISPRNVKRSSSNVAENGPRSAKRRKENAVVDLIEEQPRSNAFQRDAAEVAMIAAHTRRHSTSGKHRRLS